MPTVYSHRGRGFAFEQITFSTSALPFTLATWSPSGDRGANRAILTLESGDIRYLLTGDTATATVGQLLDATTEPQVLIIEGKDNIQHFSAIRNASVNGIASIHYERGGMVV